MQVPAARDIHLACFSIEVADHADEPWPQQLKKQQGAAYCCVRQLSCESKQMRWLNRTKRHRYSPIHWKRKHGCCRSEIGFASPTQGRFSTPSYMFLTYFGWFQLMYSRSDQRDPAEINILNQNTNHCAKMSSQPYRSGALYQLT